MGLDGVKSESLAVARAVLTLLRMAPGLTRAWPATRIARGLLLVATVAGGGCRLAAPPDEMEASLWEALPAGSPRESVLTLASDRGWPTHDDNRFLPWREGSDRYPYVAGHRYVVTLLGEYRAPLAWWLWTVVSVEAFWGFDAEDRLLDVHVRKSQEGF